MIQSGSDALDGYSDVLNHRTIKKHYEASEIALNAHHLKHPEQEKSKILSPSMYIYYAHQMILSNSFVAAIGRNRNTFLFHLNTRCPTPSISRLSK